ncbi:hypothetical protein [Burkholderia ubonensis]|uniref:hypothetical protein n=1 Tax=Burkholderia ubonensis TaxID=101571 RepID=UPI000AA0B211|nr:hypothetical protein [Burkholderia ubonensis]
MKRATIGHAGRHARRDYRGGRQRTAPSAAFARSRRRGWRRCGSRITRPSSTAARAAKAHSSPPVLARAGRAGQRALALSGAGRDDFGAGA